MRVGIDGRPLQSGHKESFGRGIGVYARELVHALALTPGVELTLFGDPRLPAPAELPPGVPWRTYPRLAPGIPAHVHARTQLTVPATLRRERLDVFHFLSHGDAPLMLT